jgi:hypothetical protein
LQAHRETDRFFTASGGQLPQSTSGQFHYRRAAFSSHLKSENGTLKNKNRTLNKLRQADETLLKIEERRDELLSVIDVTERSSM